MAHAYTRFDRWLGAWRLHLRKLQRALTFVLVVWAPYMRPAAIPALRPLWQEVLLAWAGPVLQMIGTTGILLVLGNLLLHAFEEHQLAEECTAAWYRSWMWGALVSTLPALLAMAIVAVGRG